MMNLMGVAFSLISVCVTAMIILAVLSVILLFVFDHLDRQKRGWSPWRKFATINKLSYTPGNFFDGAQVFGKYRNHHVTLKGSGSIDKTYTQLTLFVTHRALHNISDKTYDTPSFTVDNAVDLLTRYKLSHKTWERVEVNSKEGWISYGKPGIETNIKQLQSVLDWLCDIADVYPSIVALGSEAMLLLKRVAERDIRLRPLVTQLLRDIAYKTITEIGYRAKNTLCLQCLTCFDTYETRLGGWLDGETFTYYGCRTCHQSREFFEGWVVALLDNQTTEEQIQQNGVLRVNWLTRRALFDFDEVEIIQATDEDVERFAVQVGNDTDPLRKPRYRQMRCVVSAGCGLSENSHRILRRMFGSVELRPAIAAPDHITDENGLVNTEIHKEDTEIHAEVSAL